MHKLTNAIIEAAIDGFEAQKQRIDVQIAELRAMMTGATPASEQTTEKPQRRKRSAAVRARMKAAQQARWAKIKGIAPVPAAPVKKAAAKAPAKKAAKPKRGLTAEGRKALSIAMKKRWAAKRAAA